MPYYNNNNSSGYHILLIYPYLYTRARRIYHLDGNIGQYLASGVLSVSVASPSALILAATLGTRQHQRTSGLLEVYKA